MKILIKKVGAYPSDFHTENMKRKHCILSDVPKAPCDVDDLSSLPYIPIKPLPAKSFIMYIVGTPGSGKSNLWQAMLISKLPKRYYRGFFDHIEIISASLGTLSKKVTKQLPERQQHTELTDDLVTDIIGTMRTKPNQNNLLVLDDVIKAITRSKVLSTIFLNRRHVTHNPSEEGFGGLAIMITSQKYNLLPLEFRGACDNVILFKTSNASERRAIKEELMQDLSKEQQDHLLAQAWKEPYSFLFIRTNQPLHSRYYIRFDSVQEFP